jgi:hypothetical protein
MSLDELKSALDDNTLSYGSISASALANIMKFVDVELQMDKHTFDYYYEMNVDELLNSKMPTGELETLKKQGWGFNNDKKSLILYLKNS